MPVTLNATLNATVVETPSVGVPAIAANQTITQSGFNTTLALNATSTPPVSLDAVFQKTLASGTASIDFTALTGLGGGAVSFTGLRVRLIKLQAQRANANPITIAVGGTNGYTGFGAAFSVTLPPGGEIVFTDNGGGGVVSATLKTLTLTGTGSTDGLNVVAVAGT